MLEDDRKYFPRYDAVLLYRADLPQRLPKTWAAFAKLEGTIDDASMRRMNAAAELENKEFAAVAADFLSRQAGTSAGAKTVAKAGGFDDFWRKLFGPDFGRLTLEQLGLVFLSLAASIVIGIPLGILAAKRPATEGWIIGATGIVQTIPSLALLAVLIPLTGRIGAVPAYIALALYALLPIVRNTHTALTQISRAMIEAAQSLGMVFVGDDPVPGLRPINRAIEKRVPELARRLVDAIRVPKRRLNREVFEPWIEMSLVDATQLKNKEDLDSASIDSANAEALELFGFRVCPKTFAKLREEIEEKHGDGRWREELFHVLRKIANGNTFSPIQAVFQSQNGKTYRPIAIAIDRAGPNGPVQTYHITFAEDVTTTDMAAMPRKLALLATLLRFTFRFRWEVLEPFARGPLNDADVAHLDISLKRIKVDWESRGTIDQSQIMDLFTVEQRKSTEEMFKAWSRLRNPEQTGELDIAIKNKDGQSIPALLSAMLPANQQFLEMAAERFATMVAETHEVHDFPKAQLRSVAA